MVCSVVILPLRAISAFHATCSVAPVAILVNPTGWRIRNSMAGGTVSNTCSNIEIINYIVMKVHWIEMLTYFGCCCCWLLLLLLLLDGAMCLCRLSN